MAVPRGLTPLVSVNEAPPLLWRVKHEKNMRRVDDGHVVGRQYFQGLPKTAKIAEIPTAELVQDLVYHMNNDYPLTKDYSNKNSYWTSFSDSLADLIWFEGDELRMKGEGQCVLLILDVREAIKAGVSVIKPADIYAQHYAAVCKHYETTDPEGYKAGHLHRYVHTHRSNHMFEYEAFGLIPQKFFTEVSNFTDFKQILATNGLFVPDWKEKRDNGQLSAQEPYAIFGRGNFRDQMWQMAVKADYAKNGPSALSHLHKTFRNCFMLSNSPGPQRFESLLFEYVEREVRTARSMESILRVEINGQAALLPRYQNTIFHNGNCAETELKIANDWCHGCDCSVRTIQITIFDPVNKEDVECDITPLEGFDFHPATSTQTWKFRGKSNTPIRLDDFKPFTPKGPLVLHAKVKRREAFYHEFKITYVHAPERDRRAPCNCTPRRF